MRQKSESSETMYQAFLAEAARLRDRQIGADVDLYMHLVRGEENEAMWRTSGQPTFAALLKVENVCDVARYLTFKAQLAEFGEEALRKHGIDQIRAVASIPKGAESRKSPGVDARNAALAEIAACQEHKRAPVSPRHAKTIAEHHYIRQVEPRPLSESEQKSIRLAAKVKALKAENVALKTENVALKKEVARLLRLTSDQAAE